MFQQLLLFLTFLLFCSAVKIFHVEYGRPVRDPTSRDLLQYGFQQKWIDLINELFTNYEIALEKARNEEKETGKKGLVQLEEMKFMKRHADVFEQLPKDQLFIYNELLVDYLNKRHR